VHQIAFGRFILDLGRECFLRDGEPVKLRPQSFRMLRYLVEHGGRLLTKSELMQALWGNLAVTEDSIVQCLRDVRLALEDHDHLLVKTVPRRGYLFAIQPRASSIAVLPFLDMSSDAEQVEYLAEGLAEELINMLARVPTLKVASRSSSFRFRGRGQNIAELGRLLNVATILEGSVRHSGDQLRVSVQLVNAADGYSLWSATYDRRMGDVIAIQDEIASSIVRSLTLHMGGEKTQLPTKARTTNPEAHHLYLTGRYFWNKRTRDGFEKAIECWQRAIACDPNCALAYSGIADASTLLGYYGYRRPLEAYEGGRAAACKALEIDDSLAEAHTSLGEVNLHFQCDLKTCEHELNAAVELNPAYIRAHHAWSHYWVLAGNIENSLASSLRALDLDPTNLPLIAHLCWHHYHASEFGQAIAAGQKAIDMEPSFIMARIYLGQAYALNRMYKEAINEFDKSLAEGSADVKGYLGLTVALSGDRRKAESILAELITESAKYYVSSYHLGTISLALGDVNGAFRWLNKAIDEHGRHIAALRLDPVLQPIRYDPRFQLLLRRIEIMPETLKS
jgi:serine/threonine-protein kinase